MSLAVANKCKCLFGRLGNKPFGLTPIRNSSSADNHLRIAYLRESLAPLNKPNYYDFLIAKKPSLAALSRAAVLIPISVRQERNRKGMFVQKSFFTLTKRSDSVNTLKGITSPAFKSFLNLNTLISSFSLLPRTRSLLLFGRQKGRIRPR